MHSKTLALVALSATAVAAKPHGRMHHHWHGTGTGWWPHPTGSGAGTNSTTTILETSTIYSTVTVDASSAASSAASAFNNVADASVSECTPSSTTTVTATSTQYLTVTASSDSSAAVSSVAVSSAASPSESPVADVSLSITASTTTPVSAGGFYDRPSASASVASAAPSSSGTSYTPTPGNSGAKKGICFNDAGNLAPFGTTVSWAYNWGATAPSSLDIEYVPMMWGTNNVNDFASKVGSAKNVLSFNEPDLGAQSNLSPQTAAQLHRKGVESLVGKVRIGSPAVTNANTTTPSPMGQPWLEQFFDACGSDCPVDFIAFHWYADANYIDYFKSYVNNMAAFAQSKGIQNIWLTEFQPSGSSDAQATFMSEAVSFLDSHPNVERYAGFMASDGTMLSNNVLNALGKAYAG